VNTSRSAAYTDTFAFERMPGVFRRGQGKPVDRVCLPAHPGDASTDGRVPHNLEDLELSDEVQERRLGIVRGQFAGEVIGFPTTNTSSAIPKS